MLLLASSIALAAPPVVVATRDLDPGRTLRAVDLLAIDRAAVGDTHEVYDAADSLVGRVPAVRVLAGHPVRACHLAPASRGLGLQALVPNGHRALSLPVDRVPAAVVATSRVALLDQGTVVADDLAVAAMAEDALTVVVTPDAARRLVGVLDDAGALQVELRAVAQEGCR